MELFRVRTPAQQVFAAIPLIFCFFMVVSMVMRSGGRRSILASGSALGEAQSVFDALDAKNKLGSKLHLQDFHRVEVKDGKPTWEIRASDAKYYAKDEVSHVHEASVIVYREDNSKIKISANAAKLYLDGESLRRAVLEGDVHMLVDASTQAVTDLAVYDAGADEITSPGKVEITGAGFEVSGVGLRVGVKNQSLKLLNDVFSYFEQGANLPTKVSLGDVKK